MRRGESENADASANAEERSVGHKLLRGLFVFALMAPPASAQTVPTVKIAAWEPSSNGTGVRFVAVTPTAGETDDTPLPDETPSGRFQYGIDTSELRWGDECRCFRYYVVSVRSRATRLVTRHKFKALP